MQAPASLRNWRSSFHTEQATFGIDSTKSASVLLPTAAHNTLDFFSSALSLLPFAGHEEHSLAFAWISEQVDLHTPYPRKDAVWDLPPREADPLQCRPMWVPEVSHHASGLRLRLTTAGFHSRRREDFAWSHFFPRSVGFAPTASRAKGAFTIAPSMHCQDQAMPSISSYSANPLRQRRTKTPSRFHSKKYLWMELALPNSLFGKAFHWHPVRSTKIIPSNTLRGSIRFRPPPGRRRYFRFFLRFRFGIRGSTRFHNSSDTVHDLMALMVCHLP
jgi:hypothetical protein